MRKLQFVANCEIKAQLEDSKEVQSYVADILAKNLGKHGFEALAQSGAQVAVSVDQHTLPLAVSCESQSEDGHLVCTIISYPDENQDWLERVTEQSLLNQLASAVESTLKEHQDLSQFEWHQY